MSAREELATLRIRDLLADWPHAAVFTPEDREALANLPVPMKPSAPAR